MKSLMYQLSFLFILAIGVSSCSRDPCEAVACVNGSCNEGICDCAAGFKGPACDEIDYNFVGAYFSSIFILFDCPVASVNEEFPTNSNYETCSINGTLTTCVRILVTIKDDGEFILNQVKTVKGGSATLTSPLTIEGTYSIDGNQIKLCESSSSCLTMTIDATQQELYWEQQKVAGDNCGLAWKFARR